MPQVERSKRLRSTLLTAELSDDPESVDVQEPEPPAYVPEPTPAASATPMGLGADGAGLIAGLIAALKDNASAQTDAMKDALAQAATMAREQIPENKVSPGFSVYSHPLGDKAKPRTQLRCPMFLGVYNEDGKVMPAFEYEPQTLTEKERVLLNELRPGARPGIERNDGQTALWRVAEQADANGQAIRMVIAVPEPWLGKDQFHTMPRLTDALQQLIAAQEAA